MSHIHNPEPADEHLPIWPAALMYFGVSGALVSLVALAAIYGG